jgi:hypothetical protein
MEHNPIISFAIKGYKSEKKLENKANYRKEKACNFQLQASNSKKRSGRDSNPRPRA